jgi:hypothetical protein
MEPPRLERSPIAMPPLDDRTADLWSTLVDITERFPQDWTLVGGQMVFLHAVEAGVGPPRVSRDLDLVVNARVRPPALPRMIRALGDIGLDADGVSPEGVAHRFVRQHVSVDVLVPEGIGSRADRRTVGGAVTIEVLGGTQALQRTQVVPVGLPGRVGWIPRPDLLGALVVKAAAVSAERRDGNRHLTDLAFLCSLVDDPFELRDAMTRKDRQRLRVARALADRDHPAYGLVQRADAAHAAYQLLLG